jgi:hypothetical protein
MLHTHSLVSHPQYRKCLYRTHCRGKTDEAKAYIKELLYLYRYCLWGLYISNNFYNINFKILLNMLPSSASRLINIYILLKCRTCVLCFLSIYRSVVNLCTIYCDISRLRNSPRGAVFLMILTRSIDFPLNYLNFLAFHNYHESCSLWGMIRNVTHKNGDLKYWKFMTRFINVRIYFENCK